MMIESFLAFLVQILSSLLFYDIAGFPFIVAWLVCAALFFTVYLGGVNLRLLPTACRLIRHPASRSDVGEISPFQAVLSAVSATVGLGSIAGVSVAVAVGGPGVIFWIIVMGVFGMATKFAEVTLSLCYRTVDAEGKIYGGPIHYLQTGFKERGYPKLGRALAALFAVFCLGGAVGGGSMFQANQTVKIFSHQIAWLQDKPWIVAGAFTLVVGLVLFGSIKRIAKVAGAVAPMKGIMYLLCTLIILAVNYEEVPRALYAMLTEAFTAQAAQGGMFVMIALAFKRALFANEAGLGSAPIAHAAATVQSPAHEGTLALVEPLFAAFIALLTGLMVVVTNAHINATIDDGVVIAAQAFATVSPWFTAMLAFNVLLFAYGTTIGWSYYGEIAWCHLFGKSSIRIYYMFYIVACFIGGISHFSVVLDLADLFILGMALPNIIALYVLRGRIKAEMMAFIKIK
ncbi:MAG: amino acid carrier protein [Alphaproteobacteria bacterium]|nr:MAG: amino acid carrier protein [Alphaproteobacteria bacterium]TAF76504.1 MAG: amino acid carrier protein [Alphaproteobacteria bacterium]